MENQFDIVDVIIICVIVFSLSTLYAQDNIVNVMTKTEEPFKFYGSDKQYYRLEKVDNPNNFSMLDNNTYNITINFSIGD